MMFNEYSVYQMMKLRQEETERNAKEAWKHYELLTQENHPKESRLDSSLTVDPC